jgi:hypothetical protein
LSLICYKSIFEEPCIILKLFISCKKTFWPCSKNGSGELQYTNLQNKDRSEIKEKKSKRRDQTKEIKEKRSRKEIKRRDQRKEIKEKRSKKRDQREKNGEKLKIG